MMRGNFILMILILGSLPGMLSGQCPSGITVTADVTDVCYGGSVTLTCNLPQSGGFEDSKLTILSWWYSSTPTNPSSWVNMGMTGKSITLDNRNTTLSYRAYVQYEGCSAVNTSYATVTVWAPSAGGSLQGSAEVCHDGNSGNLILGGENGSVVSWYKRDATDPDWIAIPGTSGSFTYNHVLLTTRYRVEVRNGVCPSAYSSEAVVTVNPNPVVSFTASLTCDGNATRFTNQTTISSGSINTCQWSFGDGAQSAQTNPVKQYYNADTYEVTLTAVSNKNCPGSIMLPVTVHPNPVSGFTALDNCSGIESVFVNTTQVRSGEGISYRWDFGDEQGSAVPSATHLYDAAGTYRVKLVATTVTGQCRDSVIRDITIFPLPVAGAGRDTSLFAGSSVRLQASGGTRYMWSPADGLSSNIVANPIASPKESTLYEVTVTDADGCVNKAQVHVAVNNDFTLMPYNVITPDGNGENDTWVVEYIDHYPEAHVRILNRWGEEVYASGNYSNADGWDGKNKNGDVLPEGTYYYIITLKGENKVYKGAITLLRR